METVAELKARDAELEREWQWLVEALNTVARARAENGDAQAFRLMQAQCMAVGQRPKLWFRNMSVRLRTHQWPQNCRGRSNRLADNAQLNLSAFGRDKRIVKQNPGRSR